MLRCASCVGIDVRVLWLMVREWEVRLGPVRRVILRRNDSSRTMGTMIDGGDWDMAPREVEVLGRCVCVAGIDWCAGRKAERRKINLRAIIFSSETMIVRVGMARSSSPLDLCCWKYRFLHHAGLKACNQSVCVPRKPVSRLRRNW